MEPGNEATQAVFPRKGKFPGVEFIVSFQPGGVQSRRGFPFQGGGAYVCKLNCGASYIKPRAKSTQNLYLLSSGVCLSVSFCRLVYPGMYMRIDMHIVLLHTSIEYMYRNVTFTKQELSNHIDDHTPVLLY